MPDRREAQNTTIIDISEPSPRVMKLAYGIGIPQEIAHTGWYQGNFSRSFHVQVARVIQRFLDSDCTMSSADLKKYAAQIFPSTTSLVVLHRLVDTIIDRVNQQTATAS